MMIMIMIFNGDDLHVHVHVHMFGIYNTSKDIEILSRRRRDVGFSLGEAIPCARRKSGGFHEMLIQRSIR